MSARSPLLPPTIRPAKQPIQADPLLLRLHVLKAHKFAPSFYFVFLHPKYGWI